MQYCLFLETIWAAFWPNWQFMQSFPCFNAHENSISLALNNTGWYLGARFPGLIRSSGYCLCGVSHVFLMSEWASSGFSSPQKSMQVAGLAMPSCPTVWICFCPVALYRFLIQVYSCLMLHVPGVRVGLDPLSPWPEFWTWMNQRIQWSNPK